MGKMIFEFPDLTADSISALHIYSRPAPRKPRTVTATSRAVNFEILNPPDAVDDNNCYAFTWVGKKALCFCRWKVKAGMPQKTSIEIGRMIMEEEWQGKNRAAYAQQLL